MKHCAYQPSAFAAREEMRSSVSVPMMSERTESVVCPKPRRVGLLSSGADYPVRPLRWHHGHQSDLYDSRSGSDLLELLLTKGGCGVEQSCNNQVASSPPFFSGSPPSRVSNPLIQDARFGDEKVSFPFPPAPSPPPASSRTGGGCVRGNFGNKPAVRVEGFDCLDRDSRNCSIPTLV